VDDFGHRAVRNVYLRCGTRPTTPRALTQVTTVSVMIRRHVWLVPVGLAVSMVAVLFQLAINTGQWKVAGCQSPPHEKKLLDRYEANRAITVGPPGATGRDPVRGQACIRRGRDITDASVTRRWSGKRPYGETELRSLYDRAGWGSVIETGPAAGWCCCGTAPSSGPSSVTSR